MLMREELHHRENSKGKQKKDLLPINLHFVETRKPYESLNIKKKVIIKEEYSDANFTSNGNQYHTQGVKPLNNNNKIGTRTNFLSSSMQRQEKENLLNNQSQLNNKNDKKLIFNESGNKLFRSVSPYKSPSMNENKTYSPIKEKLKAASKNKLTTQPLQNSHRLSVASGISNMIQNIGNSSGGNNHIAEAYNSKTKSFSLNTNGYKSNGNNGNINLNNNNYLTLDKDDKKLPNVNQNLRPNLYKAKLEDNYLSNEKSNQIEKAPTRGYHRPSNSINFSSTNYSTFNYKKETSDITSDFLTEGKNKVKRDLTPNNTTKFLLLKENSEKNILSNANGSTISRHMQLKSLSHQRQNSRDLSSIYANKSENGDSEKSQSIIKKPFINKFSTKSKAGVAFDGTFKTNQDSFLAKTKIFNLDNYSIFGVFDGHGMHGHFVSNMIKLFLADYYSRLDLFVSKEKLNSINMSTTKRMSNLNKNQLNSSSGLKEEQIYEKVKEKNYNLIKNSFYQAETALSQSKYEVNFSGATCVVVLLVDDKIICANAGDSRAILVVSDLNSDEDKVIPLSRDHKPELKEETNRIVKSGGRVERYTENGIKSGPFRVWLKNENFPGLAMSRSVGDFVAESVGVICEPEIFEYTITGNNCKFIVIASDGVWEFLSNEKVADIVNHYYRNNDANGAADKIVEEAVKKWKQEDDVVDDITAVVIFFNK